MSIIRDVHKAKKIIDDVRISAEERQNLPIKRKDEITNSYNRVRDICVIECVPDLIDLLSSSNSTVAWHAADALGNIGDTRAISALVNALNSSNVNLRESAIDSLGKMNAKIAFSKIQELQNSDSSDIVRKAAKDALSKLK